jgi:hypothetical protein
MTHDHGGFFLLRFHVVVMDGCSLISVVIMVVGVVTSLHVLVCMVSLHQSSYFWGEGAIYVACRLRLAFPPTYLFEFNGLYNWTI